MLVLYGNVQNSNVLSVRVPIDVLTIVRIKHKKVGNYSEKLSRWCAE